MIQRFVGTSLSHITNRLLYIPHKKISNSVQYYAHKNHAKCPIMSGQKPRKVSNTVCTDKISKLNTDEQ